MKPRSTYLVLCVVGTVLPYSQFIPFLREHGLVLRLFLAQLFANQISAFFALDVLVSAVVLWAFVRIEGRRTGIPHRWAPILATVLVGGSLGLPLFLFLRERQFEGHPG